MIRTAKEFIAEHGDYVRTGQNGGWLLFADGALMEDTRNGALREPPSDPFERQKLIVEYREVRLAQAVQEYDEYLDKVNRDDSAYWRQDEILAALNRLERKVKVRKRAVKAAQRELNRHDPDWMSPEEKLRIAQEHTEQSERQAAFREKLKSYQV